MKYDEQKHTYLSKPIAIRWKTEVEYKKDSSASIIEHPYLPISIISWK